MNETRLKLNRMVELWRYAFETRPSSQSAVLPCNASSSSLPTLSAQSCLPNSAWVRSSTNSVLKFFGGSMIFVALRP